MNNFYGALKPKVDKRDYSLRAGVSDFPKSWSCEELMPVKDQKNVNSCVAHAASTILETLHKLETGKYYNLSTDFIYGMQGIAYGRKEQGMYLRDACKIAKNYGDAMGHTITGNTEQPVCTNRLEKLLDYSIYEEAATFKIKSYATCKSDNDIKHALMNYGPVLASIKWYDNYFLNNKVITMNKNSAYGYHAVVVYGWNEQGWLCQNSWGRDWNEDGRFIYPFSEEFEEVWSFVDADNNDINKPKRNNFLDILYKILNAIINYFKG